MDGDQGRRLGLVRVGLGLGLGFGFGFGLGVGLELYACFGRPQPPHAPQRDCTTCAASSACVAFARATLSECACACRAARAGWSEGGRPSLQQACDEAKACTAWLGLGLGLGLG